MRRYLLFCSFAMLAIKFSHAAAFTSIATGNFNSPAIWSVVGVDADGIPDADDDITISAGNTVTLVASSSIKSITTNNTGSFKLNTFALLVWGNMTNNGSIGGNGSIQFYAVGTFSGANSVAPVGSIYFYSNYTIAAGSTLSASGSCTVSANVTVNNNGSMAFTGTLSMQSTSVFVQGPNAILWLGATPT